MRDLTKQKSNAVNGYFNDVLGVCRFGNTFVMNKLKKENKNEYLSNKRKFKKNGC